jgi:SMC interacting uncharacterized protein involved in chromosome segregation
MIEDLRKKTEELVINVYKLAVASNSIEDVALEEAEPKLARELHAVELKIDDLLTEVNELELELSSPTDEAEFIRKLNKIIDDTDALDSQILAMPRPKNRVGRPKFYERIRVMNFKVSRVTENIIKLRQKFPPLAGDPTEIPNSPVSNIE